MPGEGPTFESAGAGDAATAPAPAAALTPAAAAKDSKDKEKEKDGLWKSILQDVAASTTTRHLPPKNVLVLGEARRV